MELIYAYTKKNGMTKIIYNSSTSQWYRSYC